MQDPDALRAPAAEAISEAGMRRLWSAWRAATLHRLLLDGARALASRRSWLEEIGR